MLFTEPVRCWSLFRDFQTEDLQQLKPQRSSCVNQRAPPSRSEATDQPDCLGEDEDPAELSDDRHSLWQLVPNGKSP
ncbi:hypothetical protein OJAV_G00017700 [Oryzias javanicus]|uniref:Uncharacterized protein n=1 Tax=Oryzias javanicus TaxID=123683 RepID=A0A437DL23_ORYJA|nr:hypothetical protein OJAV_G00017700 [Oryzias javanicus]